jgi:flagellar capping protein FliD
MAQLDTYRNTLIRKRGELAKLSQDLAKEQTKISPLQQKIISANNAIKRTKSQSTVKSKLSEIERANKSIADTQKKCGSIQKKIAQKEKEVATADKNYRAEEAKANKKQSLEAARQTEAMEQAIRQHGYTQAQMQAEIERLKGVPEKITVLFMAANPTDTPQLRLDEEARSIQEKIRLSEYRDSVHFESRWATRSSDILQAINETNPTIVHISGHGAQTGGLALLNPDGSTKIVTKEAITMAMATASDTIRLVVFNACFSESQAESVVEHIEAAIGMSDSIRDDTACTFAAQLYSSIGFGRSLQTSFNQAIAELLLEGIPGENIPQIYARDNIDLNDVILVRPDM